MSFSFSWNRADPREIIKGRIIRKREGREERERMEKGREGGWSGRKGKKAVF